MTADNAPPEQTNLGAMLLDHFGMQERRKSDRRVSPAVGEFAIQQAPSLYAEIDRLRAERDELRAALELAKKTIETARQYFPKSIRNQDTFDLNLSAAAITTALFQVKP